MSPTSAPPNRQVQRPRPAAAGHFIVEFALVLLVFFMFIFGVMELARLMFVWNTLQEVTRKAASGAASVNFQDEAAKSLVRQRAIFRGSPGKLTLADPVTDEHVRIDYLALVREPDGTQTLTPIPSIALPSSPARNRLTCTTDPNSATCVRFVRVRICEPSADDACSPVPYVPLVPLITLPVNMPTSTTIVSAESLGYTPGMALGL